MELTSIHTRINEELYEEVKKYCNKNGLIIRNFIEIAIITELEKRGRYDRQSIKR